MVDLTGKMDGTGAYAATSSRFTLSVTGINDAPSLTVTAVGGSYTGTAVTAFSSASVWPGGSSGESSQKFIKLVLTVSGLADGVGEQLTLDGSTFSLTDGTTGTTVTNSVTYTVSVTGTTATVTLNSAAGVAASAFNTLVNSIAYSDVASVRTSGSRVIKLTSLQDNGGVANGGVDTGSLNLTSTVTMANTAPVNTVPAAQTAVEDTQLAISGLSVSDANGNLATTQLTVTHGTLNVSIAGGATISAGANDSATLTLSGTQAQINTALATLKYTGALNYNGSDTLTVLSADSASTPLTDSDTVAITVTAVNDVPVLANTSTLAYTENDVATAINTTITVTDVDSTTMASAVVKITGGYVAGQDVLSFTANSGTMGNITGVVSGDTVTLTSSGSTATLAQWETALRAVLYRNSSENPTTAARTVSYTINDGTSNATALTSTINVTAVNDQPASPGFANIYPNFEDSGAPVNGTTTGITIASLVYFSGKDPEGVAVGLAFVSALSSSSGTVWYSQDGGATWLNLTTATATASLTNAFLLNSTARVYVQGNANIQYGVADNKGRLWDGTDGATSGSYKDISTLTGATGAYSATDTSLYFGVNPVNDAPTLTATAVGGRYNGSAVSAFSSSNVSAGPSETQNLTKLVFTVSGLKDGADESVTVDGSTFSLTDLTTGTTATNGFTYNVSVANGTATVTLTNSTGVSKALFDTLINSIAYSDTSLTSTAGDRVITITTVQDAGGVANGGVDTNSALALTSTVAVLANPINLGTYGQLTAPVLVEGHWYYNWDMNGSSNTLNGGSNLTTQQNLASIFKYDINGNVNPGADISEVYRYATLNGVQVALPTVNGGQTFTTTNNPGTSATGESNTINANTRYSDLLAVWDAFNGTGTTAGSSATVTGWGLALWAAQTSGSYSYSVGLNSGSTTLQDLASGGSGSNYAVALELVRANHAPVLDTAASPSLGSVASGSGIPTSTTVGVLVSTLIGSSITDADAGALKGIAVTAVNAGGTLYYRLSSAGSWTAATGVALYNSLHLAADSDTQVYFVTNVAAGTLSNAITYRAWDQTVYGEGAYADTTFASYLNGKTNVSAYSNSTDTVSIQVVPLVLDLNRDGTFSYGQVLMDINGDGWLEQTAWAGAQDGVLVWDKYADGQVHDASQYAFAQYGGNTDLQGLAAGFDTNLDGKFNAQDAKFAQFKVWQDLNQNGISDAGEVRSLADWGIAEINLSSDGVVRTPASGVTEAGRTTATTTDGTSMLVADAALDNASLDYNITSASTAQASTTQAGAKLSVLGSGMNLDLSRFIAQHGAIAEVDLSGTGANSLKLNLSDVLGTPAHTLKVTGDADDVLNAQLATDWTNTGSVVTDNGHSYAVYNANANAAAQLLIDQQLLSHAV